MESFLIELVMAFILSLLFTKWLKGYFKRAGLVGRDVHKKNKPELATSGGIPVFFSFYIATMFYIFLRTYFFKDFTFLLEVTTSLLSIMLVTFIGFLDDINVNNGQRIGLKQWQKPLMTLFAAIPLSALRLGTPIMNLPFLGNVNLGALYPLLIVPLAFMGASNMVNLLAGLNGLESGMGVVYLTSLSLYAYFHANLAASILSFGALGAVLGFFILNKYPARILPGDSLTYFLGAVLATIAIVGNIEKAVIVASIPFGIEFILKLRGKFKKPTIGKLVNDKIIRKEKTIYSLPHLFMNGKHSEKNISRFMWIIESVFAILLWFV